MFDKLVVGFFVDEVAGGFFVDVPPGQVACVYDRLRGVLRHTWGPGLHFKLPFLQKAKLFNAQTLEYGIRPEFDAEANREVLGDDPISATTSDGANVTVLGTILIRINKDQVVSLWENIGEGFVSKIIRPVSRSRIRTALSEFTLPQLNSASRHDAEKRIKEQLEYELGPKGLIVEGVLLSEITQAGSPQPSHN
jgi:regulator of protease activity HflC (stomatin/prohibitin superfamily)